MEDFVIHCVFDGRKGMGDFNEMCKFCLQENIPCVIRPFSHEYDEDRNEIVRLPAYHVFYRGDYELTFYPGDCPAATLGSIREKPVSVSWSQRMIEIIRKRKVHGS
jgi:hypothetical protein